MRWYT